MANTPYDSGDESTAADASAEATDAQADHSDEKILEQAKAFFASAEEAESDLRTGALAELKFAAGEQWDQSVRQAREAKRRPCLTINKMPQFIQQVTNDQRQNRPSIKVHAVDDNADPDTAKAYQGIIRHIEHNSSADIAYDTAFDRAVRARRGFFRIITDYVDPMSFEQEILIKAVRNPFSVFFDPASKEPDGSEACEAGIVEEIKRKDYEAKYPNSKLAQSGEWDAVGNSAPDWVSKDGARVAEYFYKDTQSKTLCLLSTGESVLKEKLPELLQAKEQEALAAATQGVQMPPVEVVRERETLVPVIRWIKFNGCEILEKTEWPGKYIPIIPVYGNILDIDGKVVIESLVTHSMDSQRMYNVWKSYETETIALAPKSPFVGDIKAIEPFRYEWETANTEAHSILPYDSKGGTLQPPQRQVYEPPVQAITQAAMLAADDLKATTGIYDASLGAKSNESSGIAIQRRNQQAQTSNFHFVDNLTRSLKHAGRILIDLIPKIYDTERVARIIGEDGEQKVITVNASKPIPGQVSKEGKPLLYNLSAGKYDVTVDVGPSYASKRQEAAAFMQEMVKAYPPLMQMAGDIILGTMDLPGAADLKERFKKTLPPELRDEDPEKPPVPPEVQQQMQQMGQLVDQLTAKVNEQADEIQQKRIELESKERIEMAKIQRDIEIAMLQVGSKEALALLNHQLQEIQQRMSLLNANVPIEDVTQDQPMNQQQPAPGEMPMQQGAPEELPMDAGGLPAEGEPMGMDPTGGESPEQPEGMQ